MKTRSVIVQCEHGLHGRVAAQIVRVVRTHETAVHIQCKGCPKANGCSMMELMILGAGQGTSVEISAEGPDEEIVIQALAEIFDQGSGI